MKHYVFRFRVISAGYDKYGNRGTQYRECVVEKIKHSHEKEVIVHCAR